MIDIENWLEIFSERLEKSFGNRIDFIGIQGSCSRGEADDKSDIDVVVIFDKLTADDLKKYDKAVSDIEYRDRLCGFLSGKEELMNWDRADLFQFYFDTVAFKGNIDYILTLIGYEEARRALHLGACNIYHACVHNILHEKDVEILKALYNSACFSVQALCYINSGNYIRNKDELFKAVGDKEKKIIETYKRLRRAEKIEKEEFDELSEFILGWSGEIINRFI